MYPGFVLVLEILLESPGILLWHFPGKCLQVLESPGDLYLVRVYCYDHMIFTVLITCGAACKGYSKNKVIVDVATRQIKCGLGRPGKIYLSPGKVPEVFSEKRYEPCQYLISKYILRVELTFLYILDHSI